MQNGMWIRQRYRPGADTLSGVKPAKRSGSAFINQKFPYEEPKISPQPPLIDRYIQIFDCNVQLFYC